LLLKASHKEQCSVIRFLWAKNLAQMSFSLKCVQCMMTSVLRDQQYMLGVKSLFMVTKVLLIRNNLQGRRVVSTTGSDATITAVDSLRRSGWCVMRSVFK